MKRALLFAFLFIVSFVVAFLMFAPNHIQQTTASVAARYVPALRPVLNQQASGTLKQQLQQAGFNLGQPVVLRLYKQSGELEVWMSRNKKFVHFKTYPICKWSGELGPKLKEGDGQSPEGFYEVSSKQLNPNSRYHLAMNIGFPNAFDRSQSRTGSALMIHGSCVSIGCYAMTDAGIEEIYSLVEKALQNQQSSIPIHIFPFRMTQENLQRNAQSPWLDFWRNLKTGDELFQQSGLPPKVLACNGRYYFGIAPANCKTVRAW